MKKWLFAVGLVGGSLLLGGTVLRAPIAYAAQSLSAASVETVDVCALLSARQVTAIKGMSPNCKNSAPLKTDGGKATIYIGDWAGKTAVAPRLVVTVNAYRDPSALALVKATLGQGFQGQATKVKGIGDEAFVWNNAKSTYLHLAVGSDVVDVAALALSGRATWTKAQVEAAAKAIAAHL